RYAQLMDLGLCIGADISRISFGLLEYLLRNAFGGILMLAFFVDKLSPNQGKRACNISILGNCRFHRFFRGSQFIFRGTGYGATNSLAFFIGGYVLLVSFQSQSAVVALRAVRV